MLKTHLAVAPEQLPFLCVHAENFRIILDEVTFDVYITWI